MVAACALSARAKDHAPAVKAQPATSGHELFTREWLPNDSRAHGGDGLGPVFNDSSCVACHNQGGTGGAGPASKNVDILTAFSVPQNDAGFQQPEIPHALFNSVFGGLAPQLPTPQPGKTPHVPTAAEKKLAKQREKEELTKVHPGFASSRSLVLHHFGTDPKYAAWRAGIMNGQMQFRFGQTSSMDSGFVFTPEIQQLRNDVESNRGGMVGATVQVGNVQISRSQRNPSALFGVGLIDAIPDAAILATAREEAAKYPAVAGRPSKQKDGKLGRFGWKAQKASLQDFALTACAVELGLNVPGHEQGGVPLKPDYKAPGLDMNQAECNALVAYLKALPQPERHPGTGQEAATIRAGHTLFASTGCAACHAEKLGSVNGLYSDLLLHDMGPELGDTGNYGVFTPDSPEEEQDQPLQEANGGNPFNRPSPQVKLTPAQLAKVVGAMRQEWRTPPLWGVRDSGPYLHDGRADTLEQAIAFHGGQAAGVTTKFFQLKPEERQQVIAFLKSLTAPDQTALEPSELVDSGTPTAPNRGVLVARPANFAVARPMAKVSRPE
jgi:CxxC motif-containing protein (DUF1111 family)